MVHHNETVLLRPAAAMDWWQRLLPSQQHGRSLGCCGLRAVLQSLSPATFKPAAKRHPRYGWRAPINLRCRPCEQELGGFQFLFLALSHRFWCATGPPRLKPGSSSMPDTCSILPVLDVGLALRVHLLQGWWQFLEAQSYPTTATLRVALRAAVGIRAVAGGLNVAGTAAPCHIYGLPPPDACKACEPVFRRD